MTDAVLFQHRTRLLELGELSVQGVNRKLRTLKRLFAWGRDNGFVPKELARDIADVRPLRKGEVAPRGRTNPKRVPTLEEVRAVMAKANRQVAGLLQVQLYSGMRPGEACALRWVLVHESRRNSA